MVVSDDEKENIDILPQDSTFRIEPTVNLEPKPSVPSYIYNPIINFAGSAAGVADNDGDGNVRLEMHRRVSRTCSLLMSVGVVAKTSINKKS